MAAARQKQMVAQQQFPAELDGKTVVVLEGARFPANAAIVSAHKSKFKPAKGS